MLSARSTAVAAAVSLAAVPLALAASLGGCGGASIAGESDGNGAKGSAAGDAGSGQAGDAAAVSFDAGPPADAGRVEGDAVCALSLSGAIALDVSCSCSANLSGTPASGTLTTSVFCKAPGFDYVPFQISIGVTAATVSGTYPSTSEDLEVADWEDPDAAPSVNPAFVSTSAPGVCTETLDVFAPATRGGLAARIDCADLVDGSKHVTLHAEVRLLAADAEGAGSATDAGAADGAMEDADSPDAPDPDASTCTMQVTGAYPTPALAGEAYVLPGYAPGPYASCGIAEDGVGIWGTATGPGGILLVAGPSWCAGECTSEYDGACTVTATRNDGVVGGRFVGGFACPDLVAADATHVSVTASMDAVISNPPQ